MLDLRSLGYRVEDYFNSFPFPSLELGGFGAVDLVPLAPMVSPLLFPLSLGFGIGRNFYGSGLLGGFDFLSFGNNSIAADVGDAATRISGWDLRSVDPFYRGASSTWPALPFPFANPLAPSSTQAAAAAPYAPAASAGSAPQNTRGAGESGEQRTENGEQRTENEELRAKNEELKTENERLKTENEGGAGGPPPPPDPAANKGANKPGGARTPSPKVDGLGSIPFDIKQALVVDSPRYLQDVPVGVRTEVVGLKTRSAVKIAESDRFQDDKGKPVPVYFVIGQNLTTVHKIFQDPISKKWATQANWGTLSGPNLYSKHLPPPPKK